MTVREGPNAGNAEQSDANKAKREHQTKLLITAKREQLDISTSLLMLHCTLLPVGAKRSFIIMFHADRGGKKGPI